MFQKQLPVALHMWFPDQEGWAYHPDLKDVFQGTRKAVDKYLKSNSKEEAFVVTHEGGVLVGEKRPDKNCKNPRARNRSPFVLSYVLIKPSDQISNDQYPKILEQLRALPLPTQRGRSGDLTISIDSEPVLKTNNQMGTQDSKAKVLQIERQASNSQVHQSAHTYESQQKIDALRYNLEETDWTIRDLAREIRKLEKKYEKLEGQLSSIRWNISTVTLIVYASILSMLILVSTYSWRSLPKFSFLGVFLMLAGSLAVGEFSGFLKFICHLAWFCGLMLLIFFATQLDLKRDLVTAIEFGSIILGCGFILMLRYRLHHVDR